MGINKKYTQDEALSASASADGLDAVASTTISTESTAEWYIRSAITPTVWAMAAGPSIGLSKRTAAGPVQCRRARGGAADVALVFELSSMGIPQCGGLAAVRRGQRVRPWPISGIGACRATQDQLAGRI